MHYLSRLEAGNQSPACGFDLDGVLTHTDEAILRGAHERGLLVGRTPADIWTYYWEHAFPGEISNAQMMEILNVPGFYRHLNPCEFMLDAIRHADREGFQVHLVTARRGPSHVQSDTRAWLEQHGVPHSHLVYREARDKAAYAAEHGLRFFVEDRFDTANEVAAHCPVLLVESPYNVPFRSEAFDLAPGVHRIHRLQAPYFLAGLMAGLGHRRVQLAA